MRRLRRRWSADEGAEVIEFAIVAPLMLLIVLGIMDFGLLFQRYHVLTNAAREGARLAALGYANPDVEARVVQYLTAGGLADAPPPVVGPPEVVALVGEGPCMRMRPVTASYPHDYSFIGGIASFFGSTAFTATTLQVTVRMRNELAAAATCSAP
jgi:hypothetical protein